MNERFHWASVSSGELNHYLLAQIRFHTIDIFSPVIVNVFMR